MQNQSGAGIKKRLACDRCHSRKLRCSGDLDGCSRCVGDNSVCTYSPALKVGRPSKASMSPRNPQQQETQSISETAFYDVDALSADSGISMPPSPPQLAESCIAALDHSALFDSFDFTSNLGNFNTTHPFLDVTANQDWTVPTSPQPISSHEPIIDPRLQSHETATTNPLERLPSLQQQLLRTRLPSRDSGASVKSVENAMKPVQETLGVVTDLLKQCIKKGSDSVCSDWQTVLHLVLTPLSLLLSTYDQILNEICNSKGCALSDCRIAGLQLDPPLRLILLATVVDYQLKHLYHTVRLFQSQFMHSTSLGIADCMSSATMAEVQSTIRSLLSVTRNTLQQSQDI